MKIYHQAGHNTSWNIDSYESGGVGDGIIFSPVHYNKTNVEKASKNNSGNYLFDPQFYIPDSTKTKLQSYDFFPEKIISTGFSTIDYEAVVVESAKRCIDFQISNDFESIIIPARFISEMVTDYVEQQRNFTIDPFLDECNRLSVDKEIFITLPVTTMMTQDLGYRKKILDWITSYPEIKGVYFLNLMDENSKQIKTYNSLKGHVDFTLDLQNAELDVISGYSNTEAVLYSCLEPYAVTIGAYENTRKFTIDKFIDNNGTKRGPAPRLYFPKLLNWVRYETIIEIKEDHPKLWEKIYTASDYSEQVFAAEKTPTFNRPEIYKHHFKTMFEQLSMIRQSSNKIDCIKDYINQAEENYILIEETGIEFFDENCNGDHLHNWKRILKSF